MVSKLILLVGLCIMSCNSQTTSGPLSDLRGQWRITEIKSLMEGVVEESKEEYDERIYSTTKCLKSTIHISSDSIIVKGESCNLLACGIDTASIAEIAIVDGNDVEDFGTDKKVSRDLVKYLFGDNSNRENFIKVIYTDCPTFYGDFGLKIILIDPQTIVLFNYYNAYFLSKMKQ